jgi:DNA-binding MarR family transcriptional regulator
VAQEWILVSTVDQTQAEIPPFHAASEILAQPRFAEARMAWVRAILVLYDDDPFLSRFLNEVGRALVFLNILCLYAGYEEQDRATWPTLRLLNQTLAKFGLASARRVDEIVARFKDTGYVESHAARLDRRARILTPTAKTFVYDHGWLAAYYTPLNIVFPNPGYAQAMRHDPAFQKAQRKAARHLSGYAAKLMGDNPTVMHFMAREAGMMVLIKLVELDQTHDGRSLAQFSFADLARGFGISRTHVRSMLQEAEGMGLVKLSKGRAGVDALAPSLIEAFDRFVADCMSGNDLIFRMAMAGFDGRAT